MMGNPYGNDYGTGPRDLFLPAAVGAAGSVIGGIINSASQNEANSTNERIADKATAFNAREGEKTRAFNSAEARINRNFQQEMSNSAYQRAMKDMRAAGLNPLLAISQGGAGTPSGATASGSAATAATTKVDSTRPGDAITNGANSAMDALRLQKDMESADSQIKLNRASEAVRNTETLLNTANAGRAMKSERAQELANEAAQTNLDAVKVEAETRHRRAIMDQENQRSDDLNRRINERLGTVNKALDAGTGGKAFPRFRRDSQHFTKDKTGAVIEHSTGEVYEPYNY